MQTYQLIFLSLFGVFIIRTVDSCNDAVCASVVSKCMLTQACKCELKNCSCCQECFTCLSYLYDECCSCVDMCPKRKDTDSLSSKSHVESYQDPIPDLFRALMAEPDSLNRWQVYTITGSAENANAYFTKLDQKLKLNTNNEQEVAPIKDILSYNCTVAYMSQCMSWNKCKQSCQATGASKYRWFHDGCCECVGPECISYGSEKSKCAECSLNEMDDVVSAEEKAAYYYDAEPEFAFDDKSARDPMSDNSMNQHAMEGSRI